MFSQKFTAQFLCAFFILFTISCSGSSTSTSTDSSDSEFVPLSGEVFSIVASDTTATTCTVTGEGSRELGSGAPGAVEYQVGGEQMAVITCDSESAIFLVGDSGVALDSTSTTIANSLGTSNLDAGVEFLGASINSLLAADTPGYSDDDKDDVIDSLANWLDAIDEIETLEVDGSTAASSLTRQAKTISSEIRSMVKLIANFGDLAAVKSSIFSCSGVSAYGAGAQCEDLEDIGLTGYLGVFSSTINLVHKNDPQNTQPLSAEDFRLTLKSDGALEAMYDAILYQRVYTFEDVYNLVITDFGKTFFTENRAGTISYDDVPTVAQMKTYIQTVASEILLAVRDNPKTGLTTYLDTQKIPLGYNPAAGPFLDSLANPYDGAWTADCYPNTGDLDDIADCPHELYTGALNDSGDFVYAADGAYFLNWSWGTTTAYVRELATSYFVRDSLNRPRTVTIELGDDDLPANYTSSYYVNHLYDDSLDPLVCSDGQTYAFSNSDWTALCSDDDYTFNTNGFTLPEREIMGRLLYFIHSVNNWDKLNAYQAYVTMKMMMQGVAGFNIGDADSETPEDYAIGLDHEKTSSEIDEFLTTFFEGGTAMVSSKGYGDFAILEGALGFTIKGNKLKTTASMTCWTKGSGKNKKEDCDVESSLLITGSGTANDDGVVYTMSGTFSVESDSLGSKELSPTSITVYLYDGYPQYSGRYARVGLDDGSYIYLSFKKDIRNAIAGIGQAKGKGGFYALDEVDD
jgi:hypothetical protein